MEPYVIFKLIHVLSVVLFMGNIYTGLFWMNRANKTGSLTIIHHTMKNIILSDRYFTVPGVIVIVAGGFGAAIHNHLPMLRLGWIFYPIILFSISGIAFSWKVVPLQKQIAKLTDASVEKFDWSLYRKLYREWDVWGVVAIVLPLIALAMMVLKLPSLSFLAE